MVPLRLRVALAGVLTALALPSLAQQTSPPIVVGCAPDNPYYKAYLGMTEEMFIPRNAEVAGKYYADEFISHNHDHGGGVRSKVSLAMMKKLYEDKTFGERSFENEVILCQGEYVTARVVMVVKLTGPYFGQPANNRTAHVTGIDIYKFNKDAKVIERWGNGDVVGMLWQLDLKLPPPPPGMRLQ